MVRELASPASILAEFLDYWPVQFHAYDRRLRMLLFSRANWDESKVARALIVGCGALGRIVCAN